MSSPLFLSVESACVEKTLPDEKVCRAIDTEDVLRISKQEKVTGREVEIAALQRKIVPTRYLRNLKTLSVSDQIKLLESSVLIVGLGGLGGLVTDTLARLGVGRLHLVDGDRFEAHNLNRQALSNTQSLGRSKAKTAAKRLSEINPGLEVKATRVFLNNDNADRLIGSCDLVVDCLDTIPARFSLAAAAGRAEIPMISAAIAGLSGHITTIMPQGKGLEAIFGPEDQLGKTKGVETILGCLAPGVNLMASLECAEALKVLLKKDNTLSDKLLVVDLNDYTFETLSLF
jgi:molybdopterin/thiamine biosynthesis adenylyltransferase